MTVASPPRERPKAGHAPPAVREGRRRAPRRRRRAIVVGVAITGVLVAVGLWLSSGHGDSPRTTATRSSLPTTPAAEPASYEVTYESTVGEDVSTEILSVRRPFDSRLEVRKGPAPGGAMTSVRVSRFGALETDAPTAESLHLTVPPTIAASDLRLKHALVRAVLDGRALERGRASVSNRPCLRYVVGGPVTSGALLPYVPDGPERAEICVDARGLLLEERWFKEGQLLRHRRAVAVRDLRPSSEHFSIGDDVPRAEFDGAITAVTENSRLPLGSWELDRPIDGFTRLGRWSSISPRLGNANSNAFDPDEGRQASLHEVWTRGIDVVFIEQGSLLGEGGPLPAHPQAHPVDLGGLGLGEAIHDLRLNEVRANVPGFGFVRVAGTLPIDDVIAIARRLAPRPGGSLTPRSPTTTKETP